jgi:hypothetical protein
MTVIHCWNTIDGNPISGLITDIEEIKAIPEMKENRGKTIIRRTDPHRLDAKAIVVVYCSYRLQRY